MQAIYQRGKPMATARAVQLWETAFKQIDNLPDGSYKPASEQQPQGSAPKILLKDVIMSGVLPTVDEFFELPKQNLAVWARLIVDLKVWVEDVARSARSIL